jgi:dipeptidyl-peptidase-3
MAKPYIHLSTTLSQLDCEVAFNALAPEQALYAYYFSKAAWNGAKICFFERSYESPALLYLILKAF